MISLTAQRSDRLNRRVLQSRTWVPSPVLLESYNQRRFIRPKDGERARDWHLLYMLDVALWNEPAAAN